MISGFLIVVLVLAGTSSLLKVLIIMYVCMRIMCGYR
jgi:hypothetical protein